MDDILIPTAKPTIKFKSDNLPYEVANPNRIIDNKIYISSMKTEEEELQSIHEKEMTLKRIELLRSM